jgi:hypothetical protein
VPHDFLTPRVVATRAVAILYNTAVLAGLVHRDFDADFVGAQGNTVDARIPATFTAETFDRNTGINLQDAEEQSIAVTLDTIADVSFPVTSEQLTLEIDDFSTQLLEPAMRAIVDKIDGELAEALVDAAGQVANPSGDWTAQQTGGGLVTSPDDDHPVKVLIPARTRLNRSRLPQEQRYAVFSPEAEAEIIGDELMHAADKRGDTDGLKNAAMGRVFGFDTYQSQVFGYGAGDKGQADGIAFHRDAVTLASRVMSAPRGVPEENVATANFQGLGLRVVYDYDIVHKQDVVSVDMLYGIRRVRPVGAVELNLGQGS